MSILSRMKALCLQLLISIDQTAQTVIVGFLYIFFGGTCPSADETISSIVGRRAEEGKWWAKILARIIDTVFGWLGAKDHCRTSIEILSTKKYTD